MDGIRSPGGSGSKNTAPIVIPLNQPNTEITSVSQSRKPLLKKKHLQVVVGALIILLTGSSTLLITNQRKLHSAFTYASTGVESLLDGVQSILAEPAQAKAQFDVGASSFASTAAELQKLDAVSKSFLIFPYAREGVQLLRIGYHASLAGEKLSALLADKPDSSNGSTEPASFEDATSEVTSWLVDWPTNHKEELEEILNHLDAMRDLMEKIDVNKLPKSIRTMAKEWQDKLPALTTQTTALANILMQSPSLFAGESANRYVILFQNNTELRPTGGFVGSYAGAEFNNGQLTNFDFQTNVYKSDKAFASQHPIEPPYPLNEMSTTWGMRDVNWDVDFRDAATQVLSFYHGIYGKPAHGVIALDTTVVTDLLKITGPIEFPEYSTTLSADNFVDTVQFKVEKEYFEESANKKENEPKKILDDFIPKLFKAVSELSAEKKAEVWQALASAVNRKSILAYSTNQSVEASLITLDVAGQVKETSSDFLNINNANIGGGKSSANISEQVIISQKPLNGNIEVTLKITRTHHGNGVWPDKDNSNYMRILVPEGSEFVRTEGAFEHIETEDAYGKTYFGGWFRTPVASKQYAEITYLLPNSITPENYSLFLQRQPGSNPTTYSFESPLIKHSAVILDEDTLLNR